MTFLTGEMSHQKETILLSDDLFHDPDLGIFNTIYTCTIQQILQDQLFWWRFDISHWTELLL